VLILHGANDPRVPRAEADQVVETLRSAGRTLDYKVYENEGHGFTQTANRIDALRRTLEWFDRYTAR